VVARDGDSDDEYPESTDCESESSEDHRSWTHLVHFRISRRLLDRQPPPHLKIS
jgi:hypothetical protein